MTGRWLVFHIELLGLCVIIYWHRLVVTYQGPPFNVGQILESRKPQSKRPPLNMMLKYIKGWNIMTEDMVGQSQTPLIGSTWWNKTIILRRNSIKCLITYIFLKTVIIRPNFFRIPILIWNLPFQRMGVTPIWKSGKRLRGANGIPIGIAHDNPLLDTIIYEFEYMYGHKASLFANTITKNVFYQFN